MYRVAVYDPNEESRNKLVGLLKEAFVLRHWRRFSIMQILSIKESDNWSVRPEDCYVLFVSLKAEKAEDFAAKIYRKNPFIRVVFYGGTLSDMTALYKSRPTAIMQSLDDLSVLRRVLQRELFENNPALSTLFYETKTTQTVLSLSKILYFYSAEHYVYPVLARREKTSERFKAKLDDIEPLLNSRMFLRIHKSYLISALYVKTLDKKQRVIIMKNGDELPISNYYYKETLDKIRQICPLEVQF